MGGVPMYLSLVISFIIWLPKSGVDHLKFIFLATTIVFIIGIRDDLTPMKPIFKLINQLIPSLLVFFFFDVAIESFYGTIDVIQFPFVLKLLITIFTIIVITNSFNLIDGIDGLAGSIAILACSVLGSWFYMIGQIYLSTLCFAIFSVGLAFLYYNWSPSKIFMGDTGALMIGFLLACLIIIFLNKNQDLDYYHPFKFSNPITICISILVLPLTDTLRVFIIRIRKGVSPFFPDNNHLHHLLLSKGYSHSKTVFILIFINLVALFIAYFTSTISDVLALPLLILAIILFVWLISKKTTSDKVTNITISESKT